MLITDGHFDCDANVISFLAEIGQSAKAAISTLEMGLREVSDADARELIRETIEAIQGKIMDKTLRPVNGIQPIRSETNRGSAVADSPRKPNPSP